MKKGVVASNTCCPMFDPTKYDGKVVKWKGKFFVKDTIHSLFNIPLDFGLVMNKSLKNIDIAQAKVKEQIVFVDEISPFKSHAYISVSKPVVGLSDVKLTGNFLCKVFEGRPNMKKWKIEMDAFVKSKKETAKKIYFMYPTCPKCSRKYGKNYVVMMAEI